MGIFATCMTSSVPWQMVRIIPTLISQSLLTADFLSGTGKEVSIVCFLVDCAERSAEECCELARFICKRIWQPPQVDISCKPALSTNGARRLCSKKGLVGAMEKQAFSSYVYWDL